MSQDLIRSLVWMDYRLALLVTVLLPIVLLIWATVKRADALQRLLIIYWRVASLLAIAVYLMIGGFPFSFLASLMALVLIPIGLWFWVDLNEEIAEQPASSLKLVFTAWRWAASVYCALSAIALLPFLQCAFSAASFALPFCQGWLEPALAFKDLFHANTKAGFLGFWGIIGLVVYLLYLGYFVIVRLAKQGRTAAEQ